MPSSHPVLRHLEQAWFNTSIADFIGASEGEIIGRLANREQHWVEVSQIEAWNAEITILKNALADLAGHVLFEFDIPRMGRRIDAVVITGASVFVIEFKVGSETFDRSLPRQLSREFGLLLGINRAQ